MPLPVAMMGVVIGGLGMERIEGDLILLQQAHELPWFWYYLMGS